MQARKQTLLRSLRINSFVLLVYVAFACVTLQYATTPNFLALIWPSSGIALGAVLVWGLQCLIPLFIAPYLVGCYFAHICHICLTLPFMTTWTVVSVSTVVQAYVGRALLKRYVGLTSKLEDPRSILLFVALAGPVSCTIQASFNLLLWVESHYDFWYSALKWLTWWVNGALGVIIFTPLFLIFFAEPRVVWRERFAQVFLPVSAGLLIVFLSYAYMDHSEHTKILAEFDLKVDHDRREILSQLTTTDNTLDALSSLLMSSMVITEKSFDSFSYQLVGDDTFIRMLGWAPLVKNRKIFEDKYRISIDADSGKSFYYPIMFDYANKSLESFHGYDLYANHVMRSAIKKAISLQQPILIFRSDLNNTELAPFDYLIRPVYENQMLDGFTIAGVELNTALAEMFKDKDYYSSIQFRDMKTGNVVFEKGDKHSTIVNDRYVSPITRVVNLYGHVMEFVVSPSGSYVLNSYSWQVIFIFMFALVICAVMEVALFILFSQKKMISKKVAEQAIALQAEEGKNLMLLNAVGEGIYGVNRQGDAIFVNPAAAKSLGYTQGELLGKSMHTLMHHSHSDHSHYPKEDCPIIECMETGEVHRVNGEVFWKKSGHCIWVEYVCSPLIYNDEITGAVVIFNDVTKRREDEEKLFKLAHFDTLTQLPNRFSFLGNLEIAIERATKNKTIMAVCFIDIDNFKQVNDALGHVAGDQLLQIVAQKLSQQLAPHCYLARIGGDEFGLLISDIHHIKELDKMIPLVVKLFEQPIMVGQFELVTSISMGISLYPTGGLNCLELLKNADIAMYRAKADGKNTHAYFDIDLNKQIKRRHEVEIALRKAIEHSDFQMRYQPQVCCRTKAITGVEALIRWHDDQLGAVSPDEFIPLSEENGMIHAIGDWVLIQCLKDFGQLSKIFPGLKLSINVSIRQLESNQFIRLCKKMLASYGKIFEGVCLEVTETALMKNPTRIVKVMNELGDMGVQFALDDFGLGYSSMYHLRYAPISFIKIDKGFISGLAENDSDATIIEAVVKLSHGLGAKVVAEGVETEAQFDYLRASQCDYVQGYLFGRPMVISELMGWLDRHHHLNTISAKQFCDN